MNKLKPVIQEDSDIMNSPTLDKKDDMQGIKTIVEIHRHTIEAILAHSSKKDKVDNKRNSQPPIITAEDIREEMNR